MRSMSVCKYNIAALSVGAKTNTNGLISTSVGKSFSGKSVKHGVATLLVVASRKETKQINISMKKFSCGW